MIATSLTAAAARAPLLARGRMTSPPPPRHLLPGARDEFSAAPTQSLAKPGKLTPEQRALLGRHRLLDAGRRGDEVRELQTLLKVSPTGVFDAATVEAVKALQQRNGLRPDGTVGQQTWGALLGIPAVEPGTWLLQPDIACTVTSFRNRGQLNQMTLGTIEVNGHVYNFRCGGHGRGSIPLADYTVTPHLWSRSEPAAMVVDGVGWSFAVSDKWDARVGDTRSLLRIHPDGNVEGTEGCVGIVGNGQVQRQFREDMRAVFDQLGESLIMRMGTPTPPLAV